MKVDRGTLEDIKTMMDNKGIPISTWLPIMHMESGGNPLAHNNRGEDSRGLFQINVAPNYQSHFTQYDLFDPLENVRLILSDTWLGSQRILKGITSRAQSPGEQASYAWFKGIRPKWTQEKENRIRYLATDGLDELMEIYGLVDKQADALVEYEDDDNFWTEYLFKGDTAIIGEGSLNPDDYEDETIKTKILKAPKRILRDIRKHGDDTSKEIMDKVKNSKDFMSNKVRRILIITVGSVLLIVSFILLFMNPKEVIQAGVKIKTGIDVKGDNENV